MAQFRLTQKLAKDLKVSLKKSPLPKSHPLDDWVCDVFRINRRKIALVTHVDTFLSFLFPYREVGGANGFVDCLPVELDGYLRHLGLENWISSTEKVFEKPPVFTSTKNKKVLGHMNNFKIHVVCCCSRHGKSIIWDEIADELKEIPINNHFFKNSREILINYLDENKYLAS